MFQWGEWDFFNKLNILWNTLLLKAKVLCPVVESWLQYLFRTVITLLALLQSWVCNAYVGLWENMLLYLVLSKIHCFTSTFTVHSYLCDIRAFKGIVSVYSVNPSGSIGPQSFWAATPKGDLGLFLLCRWPVSHGSVKGTAYVPVCLIAAVFLSSAVKSFMLWDRQLLWKQLVGALATTEPATFGGGETYRLSD